MKVKLALFDFDKTIIDQDSIFLWYKKTIEDHRDYRGQLYGGLLKKVFSFPGKKTYKRDIKSQFLQLLNLYSQEEIRNFVYKDLLEDHIFTQAREEILDLKERGYHLVLVSASIENYLKYVVDILPFDHYIGTKADQNHWIVGPNNRGQVKVDNIEAYLEERGWTLDYENSVAYSDSLSADGPMLEMVKNRYLINNKRVPEGYTNLIWTVKK